MSVKWTDKKIDEAVDAFFEREGHYPKYAEYKSKNGLPSVDPINRIFGTLNKYYIHRDILLNNKDWSDTEIDKGVDAFFEREGRYPKGKEFITANNLPSYSTIRRKFDSVEDYYKGRNINAPWKVIVKWTEESIDKAVDYFYNKNDKYPIKDDFSKYGDNLPSYDFLRKKYGGVNKYYISRNIELNIKEWLEEEIDVAVINFYNRVERYPKYNEYGTKNNLPSASLIDSRFGSLNAYYDKKGFEKNKQYFNKELIIEKVKEKADELGRLPTGDEITEFSIKDTLFPACGTIYKFFGGLKELAEEIGVPYFGDMGVSLLEKEVLEYIKELTNEDIYENDRTALENRKEIDIYIPDLNLGIEVNGDYWHSTEYKDENYHINKTTLAETKGITLCHIFEYEWENNNEEMKQYLKDFILQNSIQLPENKIVDRMRPLKYTGEIHKYTKPELIVIGRYSIWNCGYIHYK